MDDIFQCIYYSGLEKGDFSALQRIKTNIKSKQRS